MSVSKSVLRAFFWRGFFGLAAPLGLFGLLGMFQACDTPDDELSLRSSEEGGTPGTPTKAVCPTNEPDSGTPCLLPEGTTCRWGSCGTSAAKCTQGKWKLGANTATLPCPDLPPTPDVPCPACWPETATCAYQGSSCPGDDAGGKVAIASCPQGVWIVDIPARRDAGVDGAADADADVDAE